MSFISSLVAHIWRRLLIDKMSSRYPYVKLNWDAVSFRSRAMTVWILLSMSIEMIGHILCRSECKLSVGDLYLEDHENVIITPVVCFWLLISILWKESSMGGGGGASYSKHASYGPYCLLRQPQSLLSRTFWWRFYCHCASLFIFLWCRGFCHRTW